MYKNKLILSSLLIILFSAVIFPQEIYNGCGMEGKAKSERVKLLNGLKNRYNFPGKNDFDKSVGLKAVLQPGDDENRWNEHKAAEITGYVYNVKPGCVESCNCYAKDKLFRDTHIELVLDPNISRENKRMIVEVTPRLRAIMKSKGIDWTTKSLRKSILGRWIKVQG